MNDHEMKMAMFQVLAECGIRPRDPRKEWFSVRDMITKPTGTTAYTKKDIITEATPRALRFSHIARDKGVPFYILKALLITSNEAATPGIFVLRLFTKPPTVGAEHSKFTPTYAQEQMSCGVIVFDLCSQGDNTSVYWPSVFSYRYIVPEINEEDIYGVLLDDSGYTPANFEQFTIILEGRYQWR